MKKPHTVYKVSNITGKENTMVINYDIEDYQKWLDGGGMIQDVLHYLSDDEREFLMTGVTPEEWEEYVPEIEGDEEDDPNVLDEWDRSPF